MGHPYKANFKRFLPILRAVQAHPEQYFRVENAPFMPLSVEVIGQGPENDPYVDVSICHYGEQNGDLMRDPEMIVRVREASETVEAVYFRNDYMGVEQEVYRVVDGRTYVYPGWRKDQNRFLATWLKNLQEQGFITLMREMTT